MNLVWIGESRCISIMRDIVGRFCFSIECSAGFPGAVVCTAIVSLRRDASCCAGIMTWAIIGIGMIVIRRLVELLERVE